MTHLDLIQAVGELKLKVLESKASKEAIIKLTKDLADMEVKIVADMLNVPDDKQNLRATR